jgi:hypothetical protein
VLTNDIIYLKMNCLFCRQNSDSSISVEHIIPESLGNKEHILPKGVVCDKCNQYFASKIEKPLLEQSYFINARHRMQIESKKGRIPTERGLIISPIKAAADIGFIKNFGAVINIKREDAIEKIIKSKEGKMIIPIIKQPEEKNKILSRFLAKVALEALIYWLIDIEGWIIEVINKKELDALKQYARYGIGNLFWPFSQRRIYSEETKFSNSKLELRDYQILHEFKFLVTKESHYYFVCAIMGIEYAINLAGPELNSYFEWLKENNNKSILNISDETITNYTI